MEMPGRTMLTPPIETQLLGCKIEAARARTDDLFRLLKPEALHQRPVPERHRLIFYLGHLEAFDWNQICRAALDVPSFHPGFDRLFEFGIDPPLGKAPADQPEDWPSVAEIQAYKNRVRQRIDELLGEVPEQIVNIALEHRLMHAETLAFLLHNLDYKYKTPVKTEIHPGGPPRRRQMIEIPFGDATLGQVPGEFGWDNEFDRHVVSVPSFSISRHKVTNGEYLEFVRDGAAAPHFWVSRNGCWLYRGMFDEIPLPLDHPVYVTHDEAVAYASWRGKSLPTEAQFHRAAYGSPYGAERAYPWGDGAPAAHYGNFDFNGWDPASVSAHPSGDSAFGVAQLVGNGWEWTATRFGPFEGFRPFPTYPGYSQNFFEGNYYVLKGASPRTAACFLRRSFRNWFRSNYPYVYATSRLVEN